MSGVSGRRGIAGLTFLPALLALLSLLLPAASCGGSGRSGQAPAETQVSPGEKAVLLVLAQTDFQDLEYSTVRDELSAAGFRVLVATKELKVATGVAGTSVTPNMLLKDARADDFLAVVFIGGPGTESLFKDKEAQELARAAVEKGKVLGAICLAPVILARAGVLSGKRATVYQPSSRELTSAGAEYTGSSVEVDGRIITADGPQSSKVFAQAIIAAL